MGAIWDPGQVEGLGSQVRWRVMGARSGAGSWDPGRVGGPLGARSGGWSREPGQLGIAPVW